MAKAKKNPEREHPIEMEIVVDAYNEVERALGWYYYLQENIRFPFARCICRRIISPLQVKDDVEVLGVADEDECEHEIFVIIGWGNEGLAVPLSRLKPFAVDSETKQSVEDWHYWVKQGYPF